MGKGGVRGRMGEVGREARMGWHGAGARIRGGEQGVRRPEWGQGQ